MRFFSKLTKIGKVNNLKIITLGLILLNTLFWFSYLQIRNQKVQWKRNIFGDASGYFVYLPAAFLYHFDANEFSSKFKNRINSKGEMEEVGCGFRIENNKIITKYFYGLALLQAPVYAIIHLGYRITGVDGDGFNGLYEHTTIISSIIYYIFSLILLFKLLKAKTNELLALTSILFTVFATNVIYYFAANPGYTHAFLFFLFSAFLFLSFQFSKKQSLRNSFFLYMIAALIATVRPVTLIFLIAFFIDNDFRKFLKLISPKNLLIGISTVGLIVFPQLLYYKYISGNWLYYSYGDETFTNLLNPNLIKFYFSTNNGLFFYNPFWLILIASTLALTFTKYKRFAIIALILFVSNSYLCASWHIWSFGCGYGSRNFVEYASLFSLSFAYILMELRTRWKIITIIAISFFFCFINLVFVHNFDKCYFGSSDWDFKFVKNKYLKID
ncbi:MAG: hypothetical protein AB7S48_04330 [Bacteroidales bacterium]